MWDKRVRALLTTGIVFSLVSVFLAGLCFAAGIFCWLMDCREKRRWILQIPPFGPFLLAYVGLVLISIVFSIEPVASLLYLKKLIKFLIAFLVFTYFSEVDLKRTYRFIFLAAGASAGLGLLQYFWLKDVDLLNRIDGFMSHWMTFSGQMMLGAVALAAFLFFFPKSDRKRSGFPQPGGLVRAFKRGGTAGGLEAGTGGFPIYGTALLALLLTALVLTFTRSAWLGTMAGLLLVAAFRRLRWVAAGAVMLVLIFLALPENFQDRFYSGFDVRDTTTRVRLELMATGRLMVQSHPLTGVGPRMLPRVVEEFRNTREFPLWAYQHLHNNLFQIAAELGIPALLAWLALWIKVAWDVFGMIRGRRESFQRMLSVSALAALVAFHVAGLFEYNFGDSEVLTLLLFLVTAPYAAQHTSTTETQSEKRKTKNEKREIPSR